MERNEIVGKRFRRLGARRGVETGEHIRHQRARFFGLGIFEKCAQPLRSQAQPRGVEFRGLPGIQPRFHLPGRFMACRAIHFADQDFAGFDAGMGRGAEDQGERCHYGKGESRDEHRGGGSMWEHGETAP